LERKLLLRASGKTLIQHTWEAAIGSIRASGVCVATDSEEIFDEVQSFGGIAVITNSTHNSGTDRVAEVAGHMTNVDVFVNLQGDEPEISPKTIDLAIEILTANPYVNMSTIATPIHDKKHLDDPACVKVIFDTIGKMAYYFSRSAIPHPRCWDDSYLSQPTFFQHVGLYAYRRKFLLQIAAMPPGRLETIEKLEQLRVIEAGLPIAVGVVDEPTFGIDTLEDYLEFVRRQKAV
jgi:3-deoxy-manno-octulosonate cytidylyltransferase (CMP-KDO synthetase)